MRRWMMDNNLNYLKEFIGQLQKKLLLPQYLDINEKYFGIKKQLSLFFTCGNQKEGCFHSN
ncbi:MAG: hypothetical protein EAX91_04495 [Candidatus Lokiarchaeota archaeon]|nr:hypothetical protein [Candidatus Lokiarchaeota archaeon]